MDKLATASRTWSVTAAMVLALTLSACGEKEVPGAKTGSAPAAAPAAPAPAKDSGAAPAAKTEASKPAAVASSGATRLPDVINWVTLDVGSATYNVQQAVAHGVSGREGVTIRLVPTGTDLGRLQIYRDGRADFGNDPGIYATEGLTFYSDPDAGPTPVRLVAINWPKTNQIVGCAGDKNIREPKDLKGLRMIYVANSFGFNLNMEATLAAGGLTWNDVRRVDIPSYGAAGRTIMEDKADCVWTATNTGFVYEMANSPRGFAPVYMKSPQEDAAAWNAFLKVNPAANYGEATVGAPPISEQNPHRGNNPHFASIATLESKNADYVYAMAKAIYEAFPDYADAYPGVEGFALNRQQLTRGFFSPVHEGAIRYFQEKGLWSDDAEKWNQSLLKREPVLKAAWDKAKKEAEGKNLDGDAWAHHWMKIRVEALKAAGMDPYWEEPFWLRLM